MTNDLVATLEVFSVLGDTPPDFPSPKFKFYLIPGWESPSFSPLVLLPRESLEAADLEEIVEFFRRHPILNPALNQAPYFNFFAGDDLYDRAAIHRVCSDAGWVIDEDPLSIDFVSESTVRVPEGMYVTITNVGKSGLNVEYAELIRRNFHADNIYIGAVDQLFRSSAAESYTVLIGFPGSASIGGGTVSIRNGVSFLTWGCVDLEHRNRKHHRLLIAACSMIAQNHGIRACALATRNKAIKGKGSSRVEMFICRKAARETYMVSAPN